MFLSNVLHLINDASPERGGAQKILALLMGGAGEVRVFSQSREDGKEPCANNLVGGRFWRIALLLKLFTIRPDVVVIHSRCYMPFSVIFKMLGIRSIFYCHAHYRSQSFLLRLFKFDRYIAVSHSVKCYLVEGGVSSDAVFVNCNPLLSHVQLTPGFSRSFESNNMFCVGGLQPWKGFTELIKLLTSESETQLSIVGGGPLMSELERLASESSNCHTRLLGYSSEPYSLVDNCPIQVIPSLEEGFGLVAIEAINQGKIIIYSKLPALEEILERDEYSFSFDHSKVGSFGVALKSSRELLKQGVDESVLLRRSQSIAEKYKLSQFKKNFDGILSQL